MRTDRRGAGGSSRVERRTVNPDVGERHRGANRGTQSNDGRPGELGKIDVRLWDARADAADGDRVPARLARVGLPGLVIVFLAGETVMVSVV